MKDDASPVTPDELVVRLVWGEFFKPADRVPIRARAFLPRADETDGISVFRAACLNDPTDALAVMAPEKRDRYVVTLLSVADLMAMGLSVQPAKVDAVPGHAVIPELSITAYQTDSAKCQTVQGLLAGLASQRVVRVPAPPTPPAS